MPQSQSLAKTLLDAPRNCWLALSEDENRIVGRGATPEDAALEAQKNGTEDPLLIRTPEDWLSRVY